MSLEASKAAIAAIVVLQSKIKELEAEKITLQKGISSLRIQLSNKKEEISQNETNLIAATSRARQMIDNASVMISQITTARLENQELRSNIAKAEEYLSDFETNVQETRQQEIIRRNIIKKNLTEYQKLLNEIFSNFQQSHFGVFLTIAEIGKINYDSDLLPHPIRDVVQKLKKLPTQYSKQPVATKRAIIQGLIRSIELANDIVYKIRELQKSLNASKTPKRIGFDIRAHATNLYVLTHEIKRFNFA
ncbi:hypothetical protein TRFO_13502 [Tritrichomonas foetus]|uniref:Uncharacterized protein n=1 Tax=Tritrichomonas foetus TaxID=1144522 RepID=A0A1J4KXV8_9EUKA|nr:hypothetical protein TRFO_13502 [Tritrichomonas foetus]|eukprot:OHT16018.1 hypothetical protein TRFO_13502 [Tritrichomonas foetus]